MKLDNARLLVSDFDACFRFYRDVMGFEVGRGAEGEGYADFKTGSGTQMALFEREAMMEALGIADREAQGSGEDRVALVFGVEDLEAETQRLRALDVELVTVPQDRPDWGIKTARFRDPDGNLIEINSPLSRTEWTEELQEEAQKY